MTKPTIATITTLTLGAFLLAGITNGCSTTGQHAAGGAAAGAVGSSLLGALTDLIVDGEVNTYRLQRNLVGGALAGGVAGAAHGSRVEAAQAAQQSTAVSTEKIPDIGADNMAALEALITYQHQAAYTKALKTSRSQNRNEKEAGLAIRALIDADRGNGDASREALQEFVAFDGKITASGAATGLKELQRELADERKIRGIRKP